MHHPLCQHETGAQRLARPSQHRVPVPCLAFDKAVRRLGAIAQQIRAEILRHLVGDRPGRVGHRVDHRVGEPGERHARRVDNVYLRVPFPGDFLGERGGRDGKDAANGRPDWLTVEQQWQTARPGLAHLRLGVETFTQCRACAAPRRLARVERLVFEDLSENVAHQNCVIVRRSTGSGAAGPGAAS